jgi:hypothetical protein
MPSKAKRSLLDFNEEIPEERLIGFTDLEHCLAARSIWTVPNGSSKDKEIEALQKRITELEKEVNGLKEDNNRPRHETLDMIDVVSPLIHRNYWNGIDTYHRSFSPLTHATLKAMDFLQDDGVHHSDWL